MDKVTTLVRFKNLDPKGIPNKDEHGSNLARSSVIVVNFEKVL